MVTPLEGNRIDPEKAQDYWVSSDGLSRLPFLKTYIYIYKKKKKEAPVGGKNDMNQKIFSAWELC